MYVEEGKMMGNVNSFFGNPQQQQQKKLLQKFIAQTNFENC